MKKALFAFICIIAIIVSTNNAKANMAAGGELIYVHIADSTYQVFFKLYKDCSAGAEPDSVPLCLQDPCNAITISLKMGKWGTSSFIKPGCPNYKTTCDSPGSTLPGYKEIFYARVITLPTRCTAWKFYTYIPNRNNSYNLQNATSNPMFIEATFNNTTSHNNSSPYYSIKPVYYSALNHPATFNIGVIDADGDSLWTNVIYTRTGVTTCTDTAVNMTFTSATPAFNLYTNPVQTGNSFYLNGNSGSMSFTSTQLGLGTIALRTREFRNGLQIGSVTREIQIPTLQVPGGVPYITSTLDSMGFTPTPFYGCPGQNLSFDIFIKSTDTNTILLFSDGLSYSIPGATMTYYNLGNAVFRAVFNWTPGFNDIGNHSFRLFAKDSTCRPPGIIYNWANYVDIVIWGPTKTRTDTTICAGQIVFLGVTGGGNYKWTELPGGSTNSLSNPNIPNPIASPTQTTTFAVISTINPYCPNINKDTVTIFVRPTTPGANVISTSFGCGQNPAVNYINSCPGQPISFCFNTVSSDTNARLYPSDNHSSSLPAANITYSPAGADSVYGTFSWTPGVNDVGFFSVDLKTYDSACVPAGGSHLKTQTVGIYIWPKVEITGDTFICPGENVQLKATGGINYRWTMIQGAIPGNLSNPYISNPIASPDTTITYFVTATDNIYCPNGKDTITIHVYPAQLIPKQQVSISVSPDSNISLGNTTTFTANNSTCNNPAYAWYVDGDIVPDVRGNIFTTSKILNRQHVWCRLFCNDTCANPGDTISNKITMRVSKGVNDVTGNTGIYLYPNPNNGVFTLVSDNIETGGTIEITNIYGQVVSRATLATNKKQINLNDVPAGVYTLKLKTGDKTQIQRFTVQ